MQLNNPDFRIETTNLCNANCTICPREKLARKKTTMGNEHFFELAIQALELGATHISLFGYGEPLIDKQLPKKISFCTSLGLKTFITTNAILLNKKMRSDLLVAGLSHIRFSAHGFFKEFEAVHRGLKWEKCFHNITEFIHDNRVAGKPCITSVTVIPMHGESVPFIRQFWEPMVDWLEIWKPHNWGGKREYRKVASKKKTCGRPFNGPIQIQADGKMIVCCYDINGVLEMGDTYERRVKNILRGRRFKKIRLQHQEGNTKGLLCEKCDQLNVGDLPLLYSNRNQCEEGITSSTKTKLKEF